MKNTITKIEYAGLFTSCPNNRFTQTLAYDETPRKLGEWRCQLTCHGDSQECLPGRIRLGMEKIRVSGPPDYPVEARPERHDDRLNTRRPAFAGHYLIVFGVYPVRIIPGPDNERAC